MAPREQRPFSSDRAAALDGASPSSGALARRHQENAASQKAKRDATQERRQKVERQKARSGAAPAAAKARLIVKVVDDATGTGVADARLEVTFADGSKKSLNTARNGTAELAGLEPGENLLSSPLAGAVLARTLAVASGDAPGASGAANRKRPPVAGPFVVAHVVEHKVKTGETFAKIASGSGLSERDLATFNFGGAEPAELDACLRDQVGCTKKGADGHYVFDDTDEPGIVYVPKPWTGKVPGDKLHEVRVRHIERKLPALKFWYQLEMEGQFAKNDFLTLEAEDGSWKHELPVGGLKEVEPGWVELVFPEPPAGVRFQLVQDPRDGHSPFYVFKGVSYGDLLEAAARQEEQAHAS